MMGRVSSGVRPPATTRIYRVAESNHLPGGFLVHSIANYLDTVACDRCGAHRYMASTEIRDRAPRSINSRAFHERAMAYWTFSMSLSCQVRSKNAFFGP
jgi:hypothetical protein